MASRCERDLHAVFRPAVVGQHHQRRQLVGIRIKHHHLRLFLALFHFRQRLEHHVPRRDIGDRQVVDEALRQRRGLFVRLAGRVAFAGPAGKEVGDAAGHAGIKIAQSQSYPAARTAERFATERDGPAFGRRRQHRRDAAPLLLGEFQRFFRFFVAEQNGDR